MTRLITEADVLRMARGTVLEVGAGTLITPAARDATLLRGIRIVDSRSSPTSEDSVSVFHQLPAPPGTNLSDGDYRLEVRAGQWRIRKGAS